MKYFLTVIFLMPYFLYGQYKGIWNGYIDSEKRDFTSGYLLNVIDDKDGVLTGEAFIYGNNILKFLGKHDFIGTVENGKFRFTELKLLINQRPITEEYFCFKEMVLKLYAKDSINSLIGPWEGALEEGYKCDPGKAFLYKMNADSSCFVPIPKYVKESLNNLKKQEIAFLKTKLSEPYIVFLKSKKFKVSIRDYEISDGDKISVYLNRNLIIDRLKIKKRAYREIITLSDNINVNEMILYAHNLGKIPPNTCLMEVDDGYSVQQVFISTSLQKSALIYFKYSQN